MRRVLVIGLGVLTAAVGGMLAGCAPTVTSGPPTTTASSHPSVSPKPTQAITPKAGVQPPNPPQPGAALDPACTRDNLDIAYQATDNTAGHAHGLLQFRNSGSVACSMTGFPVLYMGNSEVEAPMGAAATDDSSTVASPVDLAPGALAHSAVTITDAGVVDGCTVVSTTHLIAAPPLTHSFDWTSDGRHVPIAATDACADDSISLLQVGAVVAG